MSNFAEKWRPKTPEDLIGCPAGIRAVSYEGPAMLLCGPSGVGKTTVAKLWAAKLGAREHYVNSAADNGVDYWRDLLARVSAPQLVPQPILVVVDEAHRMTSAAQESALTTVESPPKGCHFAFVTTEPNKLIRTLKSRCLKVEFQGVDLKTLRAHLRKVAAAEGFDAAVVKACEKEIVRASGGSVRDMLKRLELLEGCADPDQAVSIIRGRPSTADDDAARKWVRQLFKRPDLFPELCRKASALGMDGEALRHMVLATIEAQVARGADWTRVQAVVLDEFSEPFERLSNLYAALVRVAQRCKSPKS